MGLRLRRPGHDGYRAQRGDTVTYSYNDDGELIDMTDADGRRTTYSYNADGDQTGETWVGASPAEKITYTYDADNEMTGAERQLRHVDLHLHRRRPGADGRDDRAGLRASRAFCSRTPMIRPAARRRSPTI